MNILKTIDNFKRRLARDYKEFRFVRSAHALIFSFPKCGRTWVRSLLGKSFQLQFGLPEGTDLLEVDNLCALHKSIPKILFLHDDDVFWKTPSQLWESRAIYRFKRTVFLVRHPADVIVSSYFEKTKRHVVHGGKPGFEGSIGDYVFSPHGSTDTLIRYYNIWAKESKKFNRFQLLRYEDLQANTEEEFLKLIRFLNLEKVISMKTVREAVAFSDFKNMKAMEKANAFDSFRLKPGNLNDRESFKTRRGKVGGYLDYLAPPEIDFIARKVNGELDKVLGYSM